MSASGGGSPDDSIEAVSFSCFVNGGLLVISLAAFEVLLSLPAWRSFLAPRLCASSPSPPGGTPATSAAADAVVLPYGPFGWLRQVWLDRAGPAGLAPDAAVLVRFLELGFKFCICGCVLDVVLLPMYAAGGGGASGFNRLSLSNLPRQAPSFWGVVIAAYCLTAVFAHLVLAEWERFLAMRREHFVRSVGGSCGPAAAQARRSLMVELMPQGERDTESLHRFFDGLFGPGSVHSCAFQAGTGLDPLLAQALPGTARAALGGELAPAREPMLQEGSNSPNLAAHVAQQLGNRALGAAQVLQDATVGRDNSSTAFVTLHSAARCVEAQQVVLSHDGHWIVQEAPEPRDIIWANVSTPLPQIRLRHRLAQAACVFGLLFWSAPVALIQAWASVGNLQRWFPDVQKLRRWSPSMYSFLTSYLPVLALIGLQCLLPRLFQAVAERYERHKTKSEVQRIVLNRFIGYQLASLYVTVISGSLWQVLQEMLDHPGSVLDELSTSLPKVAVYFTTFVLARIGTSLPLLLFRPWSLQCCRGGGADGSSTATAAAIVERCQYGSEAANAALVLVIGLTYSFIAPAILPACALYFGLAALVYRWLFTYVYEPEFDGGGAFWYDLFNSVLLGLFLGTLSLVALAGIYAGPAQFLALLPLPACIVWLGVWCWCHRGAPSKFIPLQDAVAADADGCLRLELSSDFYANPGVCGAARDASAVDSPGGGR